MHVSSGWVGVSVFGGRGRHSPHPTRVGVTCACPTHLECIDKGVWPTGLLQDFKNCLLFCCWSLSRVLDNSDWWDDVSALEFVADISRHFRMAAMLRRER